MDTVVMSERVNKSVKAVPRKKRKSRKKRPTPNRNGYNQFVNDKDPLENLQATIRQLPDLQGYLDGLENEWGSCPPKIVRLIDHLLGEIAYWMKQSGKLDKTYRRTIPDRVWKPKFIEVLRNTMNIRAACEAARVDRGKAERHREKDSVFAADWHRAEAEAQDFLVGAAWNRSIRGVVRNKPIVANGKIIGYEPITSYPDGLHARLLEGLHPKFRRRLELSNGEDRKRAEGVIRDYMAEQDCDRADALAQLSQTIPEIVQLLEA